MDIDYNDEIVEFISKLTSGNEYKDIIDDYKVIKRISNSLLNEKKSIVVNDIRSKYDKDIKYISNLRSINSIVYKKSNYNKDKTNIYSGVGFLLDYLPRILLFKYTNNYLKGKVNSEMENKLYCEDSRIAFEMISVIV